jgi:two-component sensor histidine kinase
MSLVQTLTEQIQGVLEVKSRNGSRFSLVFKKR